ncbi:uncharacterized protein METZ01_LOCUS309099, partial [marine metagenome]
MSRLTGCVGNVFGAVVIITLFIVLLFSIITQNIMQVDTIGDFDFELYTRNVWTIKIPERYYRVSDANYSVYDQKYKLTEKESKNIQGTLEKNQVLIIRGGMDIQYTKYIAIDYFSNNQVNHGYIITPKDNSPYFETMLTSENPKYVKYFYEASFNLYKNFKKKIKNLYSISSNDTQSQIFVDKGYTEFEYLKEAAEVIIEILDDNQVPWYSPGNISSDQKLQKNWWYDLIIQLKEQKVFCDEISCKVIKSIFNETFSEENLKKHYFTIKIN